MPTAIYCIMASYIQTLVSVKRIQRRRTIGNLVRWPYIISTSQSSISALLIVLASISSQQLSGDKTQILVGSYQGDLSRYQYYTKTVRKVNFLTPLGPYISKIPPIIYLSAVQAPIYSLLSSGKTALKALLTKFFLYLVILQSK